MTNEKGMTPKLAPYAREHAAMWSMRYRDLASFFMGDPPRDFCRAWAMWQMRAGESWWENHAKGMGW